MPEEPKWQDTYENILSKFIREGLHEKGEGMEKYRLVVTEQSQGCKAQHREQSQQYCNNYV